MKISYRTHATLRFLEQKFIEEFKIQEDEEISHFDELMVSDFKEDNYLYHPIECISTPFADASFLSANKLYTNGCFDEYISDNWHGTLVIKKLVNFYVINEKQTSLIIFQDNFLMYYFDSSKNIHWKSHRFNSSLNVAEIFIQFLIVLVFKKYAQVETKQLKAGQKLKGIDCNYKNDTKCNITYINSTWFTTLVKSDAFKVRGHFRLQPKKVNGEWTKELIWINEFQKEGYTAPARKLQHEV